MALVVTTTSSPVEVVAQHIFSVAGSQVLGPYVVVLPGNQEVEKKTPKSFLS